MPVMEAKGITKQYQLGGSRVNALAGVDFVVEKGEFVAIMGPSGSGKSTLLHMIGGLDQPSSGEVILAGARLSQLKDKKVTLLRRRNIGFVFQFFNLLPTLSAEENITLPLLIDGQNPKAYQQRLNSLLQLTGLSDRRGHKPDQRGGSQKHPRPLEGFADGSEAADRDSEAQKPDRPPAPRRRSLVPQPQDPPALRIGRGKGKRPEPGGPGRFQGFRAPVKGRGYLISTVAPASVNFLAMAAASSLLTPSLIGLGAASTRSLASFRPRLVTSRTTLMTLILLEPAPVRMTENSVFSSAGAAAAAAPPAGAATATAAAAAETPSFSSSNLTS